MKRCADCGNQAKKECAYMRCRSCCRNAGFECQTHVKSTWVPVSIRRPRQLLLPQHILPKPKRYTHHCASSSSTHHPPLGGDFPAEVTSPATFRCVRVSCDDDNIAVEDEYAYQAWVTIQGHVFKGILYDQGPVQQTNYPPQPNLFTTTASTNYPCPFNLDTPATHFFPYPKP